MKSTSRFRTALAAKVKSSFGLTAYQARDAVNLVFEEISSELCAGNCVEIRGFGTFFLKIHKKTTRFDMARNVPVEVPKKAVVRFMPGKKLRSLCKQLNPDLVAEYHGGGK